jgi:hypothetical protein
MSFWIVAPENRMAREHDQDKARAHDVALPLVLRDGSEFAIRDVIKGADLTSGHFSRLFRNRMGFVRDVREALLSERNRVALDPFRTAGRSAVEAVKEAISGYLAWNEAEESKAKVLQFIQRTEPASPMNPAIGVASPEVDTLTAWAEPHIAKNEIQNLPGAVLRAIIFGPAEQLVSDWLDRRLDRNPTAFVDMLGEAAWSALALKSKPAAPKPRKQSPCPQAVKPEDPIDNTLLSGSEFPEIRRKRSTRLKQ